MLSKDELVFVDKFLGGFPYNWAAQHSPDAMRLLQYRYFTHHGMHNLLNCLVQIYKERLENDTNE